MGEVESRCCNFGGMPLPRISWSAEKSPNHIGQFMTTFRRLVVRYSQAPPINPSMSSVNLRIWPLGLKELNK